ncbi:K02A2.6-like [Cordylochernes scorpioides]|uniref:RNA-directed DNA polymerase n=1 Tax=Cordylochernes scorpioides TaxID=51811 RepID=A0ABY6LKJ6_9ARAC|nr:K02A2.6-like [Cordylochernes scorpioides]
MEEQTEQSNDATGLSVPQQETTFEEEETSPPQGTSADPLTQIADALNKLLVARSPREIDVSPYDGTFEAQSFFDNFDAQADRAKLTYTDRLRKLPCYLQGKPLQYFRNLRLDRLFYIDVRQTLIDLFPTATEASFSRFLAIKLTPQMPLEDYYQNKTVMGMKLNLPADILIDSLTEGLPVADQRLIATVQPNTIKEWFDLVSRIRRTQCATSAVYQRQVDKAPHPTYHNPPPRHNNQRSSRVTYQVAPPPSPCKYCNAMHWHSQREQRFQQDRTSQVYSARPRTTTVPKSGTRPKVQSRSPVPQVQAASRDDSTSPASSSTFTKCKQDLCPTQPRKTDIFTTFPSNQSCLHVADPTPIICSPTIVSPTISPTHDIEISIPSNATPQLEHCPHELHRILYEFSHVFSTNKYNVPKLNIPPVKINTTTDKIIALRPYRVPLHDQQEIQTQIEQMLQHGIIAPSVSPYASPITLVTKRDKTKRFCIDYRKLNEIIAPDVHPLPLIETILDKLSKAKYYSSVDIAYAYWQVEVEPNSRNLLAFVTLDSQYEFCRLPYGFKNSPQIYHRAINQVMQKYKLNFVTHYFDDFIIFSDTLEDHLQHLQQFLTVCQHENIKLNYNKCSFFKTNIDFLGYTVTAGTFAPQTRNLDTISAIKPPTNQKTLQSFLGAVNVYNNFIPDYARLRAPLNKLLKKDVKWNWDPDCQQAFTTLKESLTSKPVLHLYQVGLPCRLYCDASTQGIAGILKQVHPDGQVHPVQYFSRALRAHERNYTVSELECLAIVESVDKFRIYLTGRLFRWSLRLSTYNYEIHYLKGSQQYEADLLSRNPFVGFVSADIIKQHQPTASPFNIDTNGLHTITRKGVIKIIIPETLQHTLIIKETQYRLLRTRTQGCYSNIRLLSKTIKELLCITSRIVPEKQMYELIVRTTSEITKLRTEIERRQNKKLEYWALKFNNPNLNRNNNLNKIVNLSKATLTQEELAFLSKGMKFRNIQKPDPIRIVSGVEAAISKLNHQEKNIIRHHVTNLLSESITLPPSNPHENRLIKDLRNKKEIIITQSDKGGQTVILDKTDYHSKMLIILEDQTTFKHISKEEKTRTYSSFKKELRKMHKERNISNEELKDFLSNMQTDAFIYGLPKIHKPNVPLRPIVAFYHSPTAPLSKFISTFLKPIIKQQNSPFSISNTTTFIDELLKYQPQPNKIMISFDVESLYPSLPHQLILSSTEEFLRENKVDQIIVRKITKLIALCLETNILTYDSKTYEQIKGISQMTRIITAQYYWKGISKSIEKFVKSCHTCQIIKRPKGKPYGALGQIPPPQKPFDLISIDTIAGFSKYGHSKTYLHVIVDHLTRYAWTFPSKSTSTLTYIQTLKTVLQQGSPKRLLSDRAPAFTSEKFRKFLITHGIQPLLTTSNNPQANGLIERLNATITGKLRLAYLENPKASWTQLVKRVTQTYNNTPHSVTSFPPTYLMFNVIPPDLRTHLDPYPEINIAREIASSRTQNKHKKDKETFDKQHRTPHFEVNDLVLVKNYRHPDTGKLAPYFTGPYKIIEIISPNVVRIDRPNQPLNRDSDTIHVNKLKYYTENVLYITPPQTRFAQNPQRLSQDAYFSEFNHLTPDIFETQLVRIIPPTSSQPFLHLNPMFNGVDLESFIREVELKAQAGKWDPEVKALLMFEALSPEVRFSLEEMERFLAIRDKVEYRFDDSLVFENVLEKFREAIVRSETRSIDKAVSVMATEDSVEHR